MDSEDSLEETFEQATNFVRKKVNQIGKDDLLFFYAYFKFANEGACNVSRPGGLFNFEAKSKWDAWNNLGSNINKEQAMMAYIERLDIKYPDWQSQKGEKIDSIKERSSLGTRMSMMANPEDEESTSNDSNDPFELVKNGNLAKFKQILAKKIDINNKDENGMTLLMWACDRGHIDLVKYLVANGCNVNLQDNDGLTCLHYAVSCDRMDVVKSLVEQTDQKINFSLTDTDGVTAKEMASNEDMKNFLKDF